MPRGVRKSNDIKIAALDEQIAKQKEKLAALEAERQTLVNEMEAARLAELQNVITESGKTPDEIIAILKSL